MKNEKGAVLITTLIIVAILLTTGIGFVSAVVNEFNQTQRYRDSVSSFWLAEAGLNQAIYDFNLGILPTGSTVDYGAGTYSASLNSGYTFRPYRTLNSTGTVGGVQRTVQAQLPFEFKDDNNILSGGNFTISGFLARMENVDGNTILGGSLSVSGFGASFEGHGRVQQNVSPASSLKVQYPDMNANGINDEYNDFLIYNQRLVNTYSPEDSDGDGLLDAGEDVNGDGVLTLNEDVNGNDILDSGEDLDGDGVLDNDVIYMDRSGQSGTVWLYPGQTALRNKKIIFVSAPSGSTADNVNIVFDTSWQVDQDVTIISTGQINYYQPLTWPSSNSRLSAVSWERYYQGAIFLSYHEMAVFSHNIIQYFDILQLSWTIGNLIANQGITAQETLTLKRIYDSIKKNLPYGLADLIYGSRILSYGNITNWAEVD